MPAEPAIRDAQPDDVAAIRDVFRRASWSNDGDRALLTAHPEYLEWSPDPAMVTRVALVDGVVGGFASARPDDDVVELVDLFVEPALMRRGIAGALVDDVVRFARERGLSRIEVSANDHARAFYAHAGFVVVGTAQVESGTAPRLRRIVDTA
jgi:GNAT superfamily N-acetyltransferase